VLLCSIWARAQDCSLVLKGLVRDEDNSEELAFAVVRELQTGQTAECNEKGEFRLTGFCQGTYTLMIRHVGCRDTLFVFDLQKSRRMTFLLPHTLNELKDVEVVSKHIETAPMQVSGTLDSKALDKSRGEDLAGQLKRLNGVSVLSTGASLSKPVVNGMQGYRILILNNGVRHEGQQWGNEHAPEIDPFIAGRLTVLRGASAVRYGSDAIGGVVIVEPSDMPDSAGTSGEFNAAGHTNGRGGAASLQLQGKPTLSKYLSWRVQGSLKRSGDRHAPDYVLKNTGNEERNYSARVDYHRKELGFSLFYSDFSSAIGIFSGSHIGNLTDLYAAMNRQKPADSLAPFSYAIERPYQQVGHRLAKANLDFHTGPRTRFYVTYAYQQNARREYDKDLPKSAALQSKDLPDADYLIVSQTSEVIWEHDYIKSFRGRYGLQGMHQENGCEGRYFIPNYRNRTAGIFAIERFIRGGLEIEAGLRYDYKHLQSYYYVDRVLQSPVRTFSNFSYNLGGAYRAGRKFRYNLNFASGWRAPAPNELYSNGLHHGLGAIERGMAGLETEFCNNLIAGASFNGDKFRYELNGYYYDFRNFIYYVPGESPELTIRGAFPVFTYTQNNAAIAGGDAMLTWLPSKRVSVTGKAMWLYGENKDRNEPLIYLPPPRFELALTLSAGDRKRVKDAYLEPVLTWVAEQERVPANSDFLPPPPAYWLLGLNASATLMAGRQPLIFTFGISNAANASYRDYLDRFRYYADSPGSNYTLRLRIPFEMKPKTKKP
jgi:iron complex outermembrane recepter protein